MNTSPAGIALIRRSEGKRNAAYRDSTGRWTIGIGHARGVTPGMLLTDDQVERLFQSDIRECEEMIGRLVTVPLSQGQFDALVDFCFQFGETKFASSTLLRVLNQGLYVEAAAQMARWIYADGKPEDALRVRRAAAIALWNSGPSTTILANR